MPASPPTPPREHAIDPPAQPHDAPMPEHPIETEQARQGETSGHVRVVLGISLLLVVVAFILAFALSG